MLTNLSPCLVLEPLPNGELAWLRPDPDCPPARSHDQWATHQASRRQFVFDTPTRYVLLAADEASARAWFTDDADIERVDCGPMLFGKPRLVAVLPMGAEVPEPQSALQRWAARFAAATRPLCIHTSRERVQ